MTSFCIESGNLTLLGSSWMANKSSGMFPSNRLKDTFKHLFSTTYINNIKYSLESLNSGSPVLSNFISYSNDSASFSTDSSNRSCFLTVKEISSVDINFLDREEVL